MGITIHNPAVSSVSKVLCSLFYITCMIIVLCNSSLLADDDQITLLTTELVALGFSSPVFLTAPQDDSRLFVLEQSSGKIKIIKDGIVAAIPFLEIPNKISSGGERGLLGLAFRHDYNITGQFYINYTRASDGGTIISRFTVSGDPDIADSASEQIILVINQPYSNHNGGMIAFGVNDDYLYIGMGDGGSGGDPQNNAQDSTSLLGKILRIDVDGGPPYSIPATNPFFNHPTAAEEIWAIGVRNPWRFSFDRLTGDIYFGDVGQSAREEISYQPFSKRRW